MRSLFALLLFSLAALSTPLIAQNAKGNAKAKREKPPFEPGKPAFTPDPNTPAFDPAAVTPDTLPPSTFHLPDDLEVTLWAASPDLHNPTNLDIDHAGRIWVTEGINYRRHSGRSREGDAIRVLQDTNGDGKADSSHVFVREKGLEAPLGIAVFDNVIIVSNTPDIIVYTDVDRNLIFDPAIDKREVLLTGFEQAQHDHSLHSITHGPDGRLYFSNGNCGAYFTDKSGKTFRIGSGYLNNPYTGEPSDDGHVYVGGFSASMNPDGSDVRIHGHNFRNPYEQVLTSFGDHFQNDNDDPPACRVTHLIEGASLGFFSKDGKRQWRADQRPGQSIPTAEWRQDDPGILPAGDIYGGGAPTGMTYYENGALPAKYAGLLLSCETGRNTVFGYLPKPNGTSFILQRTDFLTTNRSGEFKGSDFVGGSNNLATEKPFFFRPSGVRVGADGAIYVTDWFDPRTGGHTDLDETCSGAIYRIAPKGFKPQIPAADLETTAGQLAALQSPALNPRHVGFTRLKALGSAAVEPVSTLLTHSDPFIAARAVWLLAQLGDAGLEKVRPLLQSTDARQRLLAFRALRAAGQPVLDLAPAAAKDPDPAVRSELAVALKHLPTADALPHLIELANRYDGSDRHYLEAWGIGCAGREKEVWQTLNNRLSNADSLAWPPAFARLTWRLTPAAAIEGLAARAAATSLPETERRLAIDTLAFIPEQAAAEAVMAVAKDPTPTIKDYALWWLIKRSTDEWAAFGVPELLKKEGLFDPDTATLVAVTTPEAPANPPEFEVAKILALPGDAQRGTTTIQRCYMCHQVDGTGVDFGPNLTGWGRSQPPSVIAEALINPSKDIAHGFDGMEITTKDGLTIQGMVLTDGEIVIVRSLGGQTQYIPRKRIAKRQKMTRSMMLSALQIGLTPQDIADLIAYLQK
jgi:putative membrane-bound dehydrogenase-like protein